MGSAVRSGLLGIAGVLVVVFTGCLIWRASQEQDGATAVPVDAPVISSSSPEKARVLAGTGQQYALEIRAVGLAVTGRHQDTCLSRCGR